MFKEKIILNNDECEYIISLCDTFNPSMIFDYKTNTGQINEHSRVSEEAYFTDLEKVKSIILPKLKEYNIKNLPDKTKVLKYTKGSYFKKHRDRGRGLEHRKLTLIIQLTNSVKYDGAELYVDNKLTSKAIGNLILFDSGKLHEVTELTRGERFVLVSWITTEVMMINKKTLV